MALLGIRHYERRKTRPKMNRAENPGFQPMVAQIWEKVRRSVTPIVAIQGNQTRQWGTGTLLRIGDKSFLVSADHVWKSAVEKGFGTALHVLNINAAPGNYDFAHPVELEGKFYGAKDPPDIALVELDEATVEGLRAMHFLRLSEVELAPKEPGGYCVYGFPQEWASELIPRQHFRLEHLFLLLPRYRGETDFAGYSAAHHFLLDAKRPELQRADGTLAQIPDRLEGISGSSVWQIAWPGGGDAARETPEPPRIVGVQTSYYRKSSVIRVTPWGTVAQIIWQKYETLRPVLELHFGSEWRGNPG
jgi:hypothetical protein